MKFWNGGTVTATDPIPLELEISDVPLSDSPVMVGGVKPAGLGLTMQVYGLLLNHTHPDVRVMTCVRFCDVPDPVNSPRLLAMPAIACPLGAVVCIETGTGFVKAYGGVNVLVPAPDESFETIW